MAKFNMSMPDELMADVDRHSKRAKMTRSRFMQEAAGRYVAELQEEEARLMRQKRIDSALADIRKLSASVGAFDVVEQIRRDRERDAPPVPGHANTGRVTRRPRSGKA